MSELDQNSTCSYWRERGEEYLRLAKENPSFEKLAALAASIYAALDQIEAKAKQSPTNRRRASG
jgi:hypothetical protein